MAISSFAVLMIITVGLVAFFHYIQGLFSSAISVVLVIFASVIAVSYHESVVESLLGGRMADYAHALVLVSLFAIIYLVGRVIFDMLVPGNVTLPAIADRVGGGVLGIVAGFFAAGIVAMAAQSMSFNPAIMGYARYEVEGERQVTVPAKPRSLDRRMFDVLVPETIDGTPVQMLPPVDDVLLGTVRHLSEGGSLSARPVSSVHPDWLQELFGQRLGMQAGSKRVAMNLPDKGIQDVFIRPAPNDAAHADAGVYRIPPPQQKQAEFATLRQGSKPLPATRPAVAEHKMLIVIRTYFARSAVDKGSMQVVRISPGAVRLVAKAPDPAEPGKLRTMNIYPIGTLDNASVLYVSKPDDFLFVDTDKEREAGKDAGVDWVFEVDKVGFLANPPPREPDPAKWTVREGTFLEVKRLAREDLSGMPVRSKLAPSTAISVMRKPDIEYPGGVPKPGTPTVTPPPPPPPPPPATKPAPAPATTAPVAGTTPPAASTVVAKPPPPAPPPPALKVIGTKAEAQFLPLAAPPTAPGRPAAIPGGEVLMDGGKIRNLTLLDLTPPKDLGGPTPKLSEFFVPPGKSMVQVRLMANRIVEADDPLWRAAIPDLIVVTADGQRVPLQGAALILPLESKAPGGGIVARYDADLPTTVSDDPTQGRGINFARTGFPHLPTLITAFFLVPNGATVKDVMVGTQTLPAPQP